jgi:hypothetical protein
VRRDKAMGLGPLALLVVPFTRLESLLWNSHFLRYRIQSPRVLPNTTETGSGMEQNGIGSPVPDVNHSTRDTLRSVFNILFVILQSEWSSLLCVLKIALSRTTAAAS